MKSIARLSTKILACVAVTGSLCGNSYAQEPPSPLFVSPTGVDFRGVYSNTCIDPVTPCQTIGHALTVATNGDGNTIKLAGGIYPEHDLFVSREFTIEAEDPNNVPTIDAQGAGRHFHISAYLGTVVLRDLNLINGNSSGEAGGSIYVNDGTFELWNSTVSFNHSDDNGGAIHCEWQCERLLLTESTFDSNSSGRDGGAVSSTADSSRGSTTIDSSVFRNNSAQNFGGAVYAYTTSDWYYNASWTTMIQDSQFTKNSAESGGAFYSTNSEAEISGSSFVANKSESVGSAIYFQMDSLKLVNSTIADNIAGLSGSGYAAIFMGSSSGDWGNLSFVDNQSEDDGRHVYAFDSTINVSNSYFYTSLRGLTDACISTNQFIGANNLWEGPTNDCFDPNSYIADLSSGSQSPLSSLGRFGGTTLSYLLTDNSNAIDASGSCLDPTTYERLLVDQRGEPRDYHNCDIGSTEKTLSDWNCRFDTELDLDLDWNSDSGFDCDLLE